MEPSNFDFRARTKWRALYPVDRFLHRLDLPDPEARDELLGFREGAVDHSRLLLGESDALAVRTRAQTVAHHKQSRFPELFVELSHFGQQLTVR